MTYVFPAHIFNPDLVRADVVPKVVSGGTAINGEEDVIATDGGGRWEISYGQINLDDPDTLRLWEAWMAHLAGGAQSILVPLLSLSTAPRGVGGNGLAAPSDVYADDEEYPTEVRFASPSIVANVVDDAALRATSLTILVTQGATIKAGSKFSIGSRGYKVERVTARDGMEATCRITPPLREPVSADDAVNFDWPVVECRAVPAQDFAVASMLGMYADTQISFVEHVTYAS